MIQPLRWRDHRQVINAILGKLRTGAPWRDLPDRYAKRAACYQAELTLAAIVLRLR